MKVSVIVPVYNVEKYLKRCVESILAQTYRDLEIILVDDGSKDSSGDICEELKILDPRIVVIHKENGGLSSARNAGMDIAKGEYFGFVDSDDYIEPDMFETLLTAALETKKDIACCGRIVDLFGKGKLYQFQLAESRVYTRDEAIEEVLYLQNIDVSACDKLFKRELFDEIRYPHGRISEDAAIIFGILQKSNGVVHVGKPLYNYIFRKNSISKSTYSIKNFDVYCNVVETFRFIDHNYPQYKKAYWIYSCLTISSQIQELQNHQNIKRKFIDHYRLYMSVFCRGFIATMISSKISMKTKIRVLFVRMHCAKIFTWLQTFRNSVRFCK